MVFSLERFRRERPTPPFELGGVFGGDNSHFILSDAMGAVELHGDSRQFQKLNGGDLITVHVTQATEFSVYCDKVARLRKSLGGAELTSKIHVPRFAAFVQRVRDFFVERGLQEILTPSLVRCPGLEPALEPFPLELKLGRRSARAYLPTSPEISLKKALAMGWTDIFEIKSCFRNGEFTLHHEPEFLMLEWYRAFANLSLIESDLRDLIEVMGEEGWLKGERPRIERTDFAAIFKALFGFRLRPDSTREDLIKLCDQLGIHHVEDDTFNDLFHRILIDRVESYLAGRGPTIVRAFPPSMAALAKLDADGWADRFEFYWRGLEIANAFNEVTDPVEQMNRWKFEINERGRIGASDVPMDPDLIGALQAGMPPTGGIALGLERLYMACTDVSDIGELRLFGARGLFPTA